MINFRRFFYIFFIICVLFVFFYICLGFLKVVFDLVDLKFPSWFPIILNGSNLEWDYIKNLYYLLGFLDYAAISLPEIINCDYNENDNLLYEAIFFSGCIYTGIIDNIDKIFCTIIGLPIEVKYHNDILPLINYLNLHDEFELKSMLSSHIDVILLDSEFGLDKYFMNLKTYGWFKDSWEMKGPQLEYLDDLARSCYLNSESLTTKTNVESLKFVQQNLEHIFGYRALNEEFGDTFSSHLKYKREFFDSGKFIVRADWEELELRGLNEIIRFSLHYDSFLFFYKLVLNSDRVFFDSFYIYFFFSDLNILVRVERLGFSQIFPKNLIWGLTDYYSYPFNIFWDYNIFGLFDEAFYLKYWKNFKGRVISSNGNDLLPFKFMTKTNDFFLSEIKGRELLGYNLFEEYDEEAEGYISVDSLDLNDYSLINLVNNENLEWYYNLCDYNNNRWGKKLFYREDPFKIKKLVRVHGSPELTLDAFYYSDNINRTDPYNNGLTVTKQMRRIVINQQLQLLRKDIGAITRRNLVKHFKRTSSKHYEMESDFHEDYLKNVIIEDL